MDEKYLKMAKDFVENEKQFHLGFLPTEQSNPLTRSLEKDYAADPEKGVRTLQRCDREVLKMAKLVLVSAQFRKMRDTIYETIVNGGRVIFSGCGATGRLSILLESMWRDCCARGVIDAKYADCVESIMTGGDFALVRSVESFEDYLEFGRQQVREAKMGAKDTLVAITEGGETSSVLGTIDQALNNGSKAFLLFNNPAKLLAEHLERSRKAIEDPRVTVLDLYCGPMGLAGSTRMQATTSEQLIAGAALEMAACRIAGIAVPDYAAEFEKLLDILEQNAGVIARYTAYEAEVYRKKGYITYFVDRYLLDIFTDTTERSPTFMIPPYRKKDDKVSPLPWALVKNPLCDTLTLWKNNFHRPLRCLEWNVELYRQMNAPEKIISNPPAISAAELLKFELGYENIEERCATGNDAAVLITVGDAECPALQQAFDKVSPMFAAKTALRISTKNPDALTIPYAVPETPLELMGHMAIKLVLNTVSTGTMVVLGRVAGNWMSWVDCTNKKLLDRGTRLVCELSGMDYPTACARIFEALDQIRSMKITSGCEKPSAVQIVLNAVKK